MVVKLPLGRQIYRVQDVLPDGDVVKL